MHPGKVKDVDGWLGEAFNPKLAKYRRLLVLSGPAGAGKTATLRVLAEEHGADILEYRNPQNLKLAGDYGQSASGVISSGAWACSQRFDATHPRPQLTFARRRSQAERASYLPSRRSSRAQVWRPPSTLDLIHHSPLLTPRARARYRPRPRRRRSRCPPRRPGAQVRMAASG